MSRVSERRTPWEQRQSLMVERVPNTATGIDVVSLVLAAFFAAAGVRKIFITYHDEEHLKSYFERPEQHVFPFCSIADVAEDAGRAARACGKPELDNDRLFQLFIEFVRCNEHVVNGIGPRTIFVNLRDPDADAVLETPTTERVDYITNEVPKGVAPPGLRGDTAPEWTLNFLRFVLPDKLEKDAAFLINHGGQVRLRLQVEVDSDGHIFNKAPVHRVYRERLMVDQYISRPAQTAGDGAWEGWHCAEQNLRGSYFFGNIHSVVLYPVKGVTARR